MPIEIKETFQVRAPIDSVWRFMMEPQQIVTCMPGAALESAVDERTYVGTVKVKVGAITTTYKGRVQFTEINEQQHVMQLAAEGRETGGGMAKGTMRSSVRALPNGQTEIVAQASVDLTGRIMQVGRGMIQGVAHQIFLQFVALLRERLEAPEAGGSASSSTASQVVPPEPQPVDVLPIILRAMWSAVLRFFRRLLGRAQRK